jgi:hypothetical protein
MLLTERHFCFRYMTNSLQNIEKKVIYHNNTGSKDSRNEKSVRKKALDERYASRSNLYAMINQG